MTESAQTAASIHDKITTQDLLADGVTLSPQATRRLIRERTSRENAETRHVLTIALLIALATAGFATTRLVPAPARAQVGRVCSEACGPLPTTTEPPAAGGGTEKR
jgi:hypothetical protein